MCGGLDQVDWEMDDLNQNLKGAWRGEGERSQDSPNNVNPTEPRDVEHRAPEKEDGEENEPEED